MTNRTSLTWLVPLTSAGVLFLGCSSSSGASAPDASAGPDSGLVDSPPGPDTGASDSQAPYQGSVTVSVATAASKTFAIAPAFFAGPPRQVILPGACSIQEPSDATAPDAGAVTYVSAGTVTVIGAGDAGALVTLDPTSGIYAPATNPPTTSLVWNPRDVLDVSAAGGAFSAFSAPLQTLPDFAGVTPTVGSGSPVVIDSSQDWTLSWTPDTFAPQMYGEYVHLTLVISTGTTLVTTIVCDVLDLAGSVVVPKSYFTMPTPTAGDSAVVILTRHLADTVPNVSGVIFFDSYVTLTGTATIR
jgi:hypothetical protein